MKIKSHHGELCLGLSELLNQLFVAHIFILDLQQVLEGLLEELNSVDEDRLLGLLLDDEVEDFEAEVGARPRRHMQAVDQLLILLLNVMLVDVDDGGEERVEALRRI